MAQAPMSVAKSRASSSPSSSLELAYTISSRAVPNRPRADRNRLMPNQRLKLTACVDCGMNLFSARPQLKRDPLGGCVASLRDSGRSGWVLSDMRLAIGLVAIAGVFTACSGAVGPRDGPLHLSVGVERPTIKMGDSTAVTITLRNLSSHPVTFTTGGCVLVPYIAAQTTGQIVYPSGGSWICTANLIRITLASGRTENRRFVVLATAPPVPIGAAALTRGHYLIYATLQSSDFPLRSASAPLTVE